MKRYDLRAIITGLIILITGISAVLLDIFRLQTEKGIWISVGCSLIASAIVILATAILTDAKKENPLDGWGITEIYATRALMNKDCERDMKRAKHSVDVIAFGISSYRQKQNRLTERLLERGVNFRIITMCPDSAYTEVRDDEEGKSRGSTAKSIRDLITWANCLNAKGYKGKIIVRGYDTMTLGFYWRCDDVMYCGPYWYGLDSQITVSYRYESGIGFDLYSEHFEDLWDGKLLKTLV